MLLGRRIAPAGCRAFPSAAAIAPSPPAPDWSLKPCSRPESPLTTRMPPTPATPSASETGPARFVSIDLLRGLVMIVMALDHVRDFTHFGALHGFDPTDLGETTPALFLTRWITHFCAPTFSFLAGTSIFLAARRRATPAAMAGHLVVRGGWLILIELTLSFWIITFAVPTQLNLAIVLWQLGWSMIVMAALIHLPVRAVGALGVALVALHNLADRVAPESWGALAWLWRFLHVPGPIPIGGNYLLIIGYPLLPWLGIMATGYAFGAFFTAHKPVRPHRLVWLGAGLTALFLVLRGLNAYGDPRAWSHQATATGTLLSFLNVTKTPPSLDFALMTLGPAIALLGLLPERAPAWARPVAVIGSVPFLYFLLHMLVAHATGAAINGWLWSRPDLGSLGAPPPPPGAGLGLGAVYAVWIAVVFAVYPVCRWFSRLKASRRSRWLSYL